MVQAITLVIPVVLAAFWLWMFNDMLKNDDIPSSGARGFRWPPAVKSHWILVFIVLNVLTAGYYYFTEYSRRRRR
ncbi:MAG TPA: hypothetical protein VLF43_00740 [Candidatus Saccharimonadales bacterium]|nr:hypothetical protein [Candidatus Saccharimonadales bacterium]